MLLSRHQLSLQSPKTNKTRLCSEEVNVLVLVSDERIYSRCRPDTMGCTVLHLAAISGDERSMRLLFQSQNALKYIDAVDNKGKTALHRAAEYNHRGIIRMLLEKGLVGGMGRVCSSARNN